MNRISCYDWLPKRARWSYLARSGYGLCPASIINHVLVFYPFIDQACSVKMAGYWPRSVFCVFMDLDFVSVHKDAKKNLANIQPS